MKYILFVIILLVILLFIRIYTKGAVYTNKLIQCYTNDADFCGIKEYKYALPNNIKQDLNNCIADPNNAKRVNIPKWKAGKTIPTSVINKKYPNIIKWYHDYAKVISKLIGEKVETTQLYLPTSCCVLIYDEKDDFINWHFDVNYFTGRFFTVLIPITNSKTSTQFIYKDKNEKDVAIDLINDLCVVFEGDNLFHMASKLGENEKRIILCLQYSTDNYINPFNKILMNIKDFTYTGV